MPLPVKVCVVVHFFTMGGLVGATVACGACVALLVVDAVVVLVDVLLCDNVEPTPPHRASATTRTIVPTMSPLRLFFFGGVGGGIIGGC